MSTLVFIITLPMLSSCVSSFHWLHLEGYDIDDTDLAAVTFATRTVKYLCPLGTDFVRLWKLSHIRCGEPA
ncbi:hypothetical protein Y032_0024g1011 [Ancylostoma ceylanicum]|uniref:Uncharacterized protein n=1 Tax=Ancylostoma ceylanicum TaxID=53326 RepID=A0A016UV47_9BILA|nr:hypothetical protein Y032_0024g1011 [Ancylostoma ceylanicum]